MKNVSFIAICVAFLLVSGRAAAATYYISSETGSDVNTSEQAQSKSRPWAHLPCMANAMGNAAAYRPVAGDIFSLKGGETWGHASFPCNWQWSGNRESRITITVDKTWFTGDAWTRPIWDAEGSAISGQRNVFLWFNLKAIRYVTFSGIEMRGYHWDGNPAFATCGQIVGAGASFITLDNFYIHAWTHGIAAKGTRDVCKILLGDSNVPNMEGSVIQNSFIDGSDSTGGGDSSGNYLWPSFVNNVIGDVPNAMIVKGNGTISGNTIYNCRLTFDGVTHPNLLESLGASVPHTLYIHDNVFRDYVAGCESAFIAGQNATVYVWNNIWYNNNGANPPEFDQQAPNPPNIYFWNNTIVAAPGGYCVRRGHGGGKPDVIKIQKNHCITTVRTAFDPTIVAKSLTIDHNVLQTPAEAASEGYTADQEFPYSSRHARNATSVSAAGLIPMPSCDGPFVSLCFDTGYGQELDASRKMVVGAGRGGGRVHRSLGGSRNAGAYQFPESELQRPASPSNLSAQ